MQILAGKIESDKSTCYLAAIYRKIFANMSVAEPSPSPLIIWAYTDNKPGHKNQLEGLIQALSALHPVVCHWKPIDKIHVSFIPRLLELLQASEKPHFVIAAGHITHKYTLLAGLILHCKIIILMKPSLPLSWFDLIFIPEHDGQFGDANVISTVGVLNKIKSLSKQDANSGLFLIGGISKHHDWNNQNVIEQIAAIIQAQPEIKWLLTTSRRTPIEFVEQLSEQNLPLQIVPHVQTGPDWLPEQLNSCGQVWVSQDSVSMIYEALTSGANTGILELPALTIGRVQKGLQNLVKENRVSLFSEWLKTKQFHLTASKLNEAERCAKIILSRLFT